MKRVFILKGLDCPNCSAKIEKEVGALPGVESSVVNLMQQTLTVQSEKSADAVLSGRRVLPVAGGKAFQKVHL